ncbi:MAG: hypothetical protein AABZ53_01785, partial [Planctomycetota bacterium]
PPPPGGRAYHPAPATLPPPPGGTLVDTPGEPAPTVSGGALHTGPTNINPRQYWYKVFDRPLYFADGVFIEADLEIIQSTYNPTSGGAGQRAGYYLSISDNSGRYVFAGISSSVLFLTATDTAPVGPSCPSVAFAAAGARRLFRLEADESGARLLVDGVLKLSMPLGTETTTANRPVFSDLSVVGAHTANLYALRTSAPPPICPADFDADGTVDFFDYDAFVICFEGGACPPGKTADFDGDGTVDFFDYDAFVVAFESPC